MRLRTQTGGWLLAVLVTVAGCSSTVDGKPVAAPGAGAGQPAYSETGPSVPPPVAHLPHPAPTSPTTPAGAIPLPPDQNGYVFIETKSGQTRCQINAENVGCEAEFTDSPMQNGEHANGINVTAGGAVQWVLGNLGDMPTVTIDYRTYDAEGWTIAASESGTRFTNNRTGHGMFVSIEHVETF
ncbi:hypothetical protein [Mycobacterium sp.]|uniref:hypothetical protein n=1 Tax=Mycobacterium sp. TaxID=1785 RepID=UPI0012794D43|nr:hypothetical protein [Mycobacterium sp.]KAA8962584.1 MAG: hypothetical protein F6Q13_12065 [Mycobacterium sp.]